METGEIVEVSYRGGPLDGSTDRIFLPKDRGAECKLVPAGFNINDGHYVEKNEGNFHHVP